MTVAAQRADARRNRERILAAADRVFATSGPSASTDLVARTAGVGIGTVFRHFPTKEALLEAVFLDRIRRLTEAAESLSTSDDPGEAFFGFARQLVGGSTSKLAFLDALAQAGVRIDVAATPAGQRLRAAMDVLLSRAQREAAVRDDIGAADLIAVLVGASRAVESAGPDQPVRSRALTVILDGLRPPAPGTG